MSERQSLLSVNLLFDIRGVKKILFKTTEIKAQIMISKQTRDTEKLYETKKVDLKYGRLLFKKKESNAQSESRNDTDASCLVEKLLNRQQKIPVM